MDPQHPGRVLAGATFYPTSYNYGVEHPYGAFYYSDDYGLTWTLSNVDATLLKGSYGIVYDQTSIPTWFMLARMAAVYGRARMAA